MDCQRKYRRQRRSELFAEPCGVRDNAEPTGGRNGYSRHRISGWFTHKSRRSGRYYLKQGIITKIGPGIFRYELPLASGL